MGYIRGVIHGMAIGTAVGVCIAPQEGARTREQVRGTADQVRRGIQRAEETARRMAPQAREKAEYVGVALEGLRHRVTRRQRQDDMEVAGAPAPNGTGVFG